MKKILFIISLIFLSVILVGCFKNTDNRISGKNNNVSGGSNNSLKDQYFDYFSKCNDKKRGVSPKLGDKVVVDYLLELENGIVKDTSVEKLAKKFNIYNPNRVYAPLVFTLGKKEMIEGFEEAVKTMKVCEDKVVVVDPEKGYGEYNTGLIKLIPISKFEQAGIKPEIGKVYNFGGGILGKIIKISGDNVVVDFNSPLAGKKLKFYIRLVDIKND